MSNFILAKQEISDGNDANSIKEVRGLKKDEVDSLQIYKDKLFQFTNDYMLIEYVIYNYNAYLDLLEETIGSVAAEKSMIGSYPFKDFPFFLNTRLLNYIMSVKTLLDHMETNINRKYGVDSIKFKQFKSLAATEYDSYFSYRFMYKLRNFVQHCGMPPLSFEADKKISEDENELNVSLKVYFERDRLLRGFSKWGAQVARELNEKDERFIIFPIIEEHFNSICRIYVSFTESDLLLDALAARDSILEFIGDHECVDDNYSIVEFKQVGERLKLRQVPVPVSMLKKIDDFYDVKRAIK